MAGQEEGLIGRAVGGMIRRSVRKRFHTVYWMPPQTLPPEPLILVPNHHGWFDGYLMFHAITRLGIRCLDWIQEFDAFPLFAKVGGMPYPAGDPARRAATVKRTVRLMREERRNLLMFAEGVLHPPPELLPFGRALELVASKVPEAAVVPVGIEYEFSMHERPEAFITFGGPVSAGENLSERTRAAVAEQLQRIHSADRSTFEILVRGTADVNERWDMRKAPRVR